MGERIDWTQSEPMLALAALAPEPFAAFSQLEQAVFRDGALSARTKELIAVAVTHVTQCEGCLALHVRNAVRLGATQAEIAEAIWVAAELRAGAAVSQVRHTLRAIEAEAGSAAAAAPNNTAR
jgi:AhpD family alkylhydroperoxidase